MVNKKRMGNLRLHDMPVCGSERFRNARAKQNLTLPFNGLRVVVLKMCPRVVRDFIHAMGKASSIADG